MKYTKLLSLVVLLICISPSLGFSQNPSPETKRIDKVRNSIKKLGTGESATVRVKLTNGIKVKGHITAATDDGFTVVNTDTGSSTSVSYDQVSSVSGKNFSTGAKIAIAASIAAGILAFLLFLENYG